ncbi:MAG: hypothetical protein K2X38_18215 [Gemmataceae bacterium]|nr:hypothetical protein [Gemmataceae bacterium]
MKYALTLLCMLLAGSLHAQPAERMVVSPRGVEVFGHILRHHSLKPIPSIDAVLESPPGKTLIVVFGSPLPLAELSKRMPGGITQFLADGGSILIASDWRFNSTEPALPREWRVQVSGQEVRIVEPEDGGGPLTGNPECPVITDNVVLDPARRWLWFRHPIFNDLNRGLLTNNPSYLIAKGSPLFTLARFSEGTLGRSPARWNKVEPDVNTAQMPYIMGSPINAQPAGRKLLLAGHGIFMNSTMLQRDYDNIAFASNAIRWLREGPNGPRENVLFIEDDRVVASLGMPLTRPVPPTPQIDVQRVINRVMDAIQKDRILQRIMLDEAGSDGIRRGMIVGLTLLLVAYGLWRLRDRTPRDTTRMPIMLLVVCAAVVLVSLLTIGLGGPGIANVSALVISVLVMVYLFRVAAPKPMRYAPTLMGVQPGSRWPDAHRLRLKELETTGNLWEPAQVLVRDWFHRFAGVEPFAAISSTSPLTVPGGPFRNRGLRRRLDAMWRFLNQPPHPVKPAEFRKLREDLDELTFAMEEGAIAMLATAT